MESGTINHIKRIEGGMVEMETKVIMNYDLGRYELHIEGKLIGYSDGETPERHLEGGKILKELAEEKGHTVQWVESNGQH